MDALAERIEVPQYTIRHEHGRTFPDVCGYDRWTRLTCPLHGTQVEDRGQAGTTDFCRECRDELDWSDPGSNWTRTDQEMREDERAEREMFERLER